MNDESISLDEKLFVINIFIVLFVLGSTTLIIMFARSMWLIGLSTLVFMAVILAVAVISVKSKKLKVGQIVVPLLMCFVYFPVTFVNSGGINGVAPVWFVFNMLLISICLSGKLKPVFYALEILTAAACYIVAFIFPELIPTYDSLIAFIYSLSASVLVGAAIAVMINIEKRLFDIENERTIKQKMEIEALNASQNRFFSSMSHEIRTPINTIIGLNEMILREDISDEIAEDAANIRSAGKMLLNTINDILDMSKFQSGDMHILVEPYDMGNMLSDIVGMLWLKAKEKGLEFKVSVAPDIPAELRGDEVRIKQVLLNILNNAFKYTKQGSVSLTVECEKGDNGYCNMIYTVEDTGMGIKKEDIPYLFTAFKRVDEESNKHIEGTGLGLSIVKQFLDLMGGKVTVNSVYTKGSTFIIEIPQQAVSEKQLGEYDYEKRHKLKQSRNYRQSFEAPTARILVVDDNASNLLVVSKLLRDTKVQIDTAASGAEALKKTLNNAYDMIFMDHLMPEMDGVQCYNAIREQEGGSSRNVPIVVLTANAGEENRALYARTGFNGYIVKPVTGKQLEAEVVRQLPSDKVILFDEAVEDDEEDKAWVNDKYQKRKVVITTESTADLPEALLMKYGIPVFYRSIRTDRGVFKEGTEIDTTGLIRYLENKEHTAFPVDPTPAQYEDFFAEQLTKANNIIHITISSGISDSAYKAAYDAAASFDNVTVIDSKQLSCGQGIIALIAARMAEAGMGIDEIVPRLDKYYSRIRASFMMESMEYLARMDRMSVSTANLFKALMLRPINVVKEGKGAPKGFVFGSKDRVWTKYVRKAFSGVNADSTILFVNYVGLTGKDMEWIKNEIEKYKHFDKVIFMQVSPSVALSCGPGAFGMAFVEAE